MGPWTAFISNGVIEVLNMHAKVIVKWQGFDDCSRAQAEHEANARLIASAPDLLEALKALYQNGHLIEFSSDTPEDCAIKRNARAAIAKAEGAKP